MTILIYSAECEHEANQIIFSGLIVLKMDMYTILGYTLDMAPRGTSVASTVSQLTFSHRTNG